MQWKKSYRKYRQFLQYQKGFGRNEKEANFNCIRNLTQLLLGDDRSTMIFRECIKKINEEQQFENNEPHSQQISTINDQQKQQTQAIKNQQPCNGTFNLYQMDFRASFEKFDTTSQNNLNVGNIDTTTTSSNLISSNKQNSSSFSKYCNEQQNINTQTKQDYKTFSINQNINKPIQEDKNPSLQYETQKQQQLLQSMKQQNPIQQNSFLNLGEESHSKINNSINTQQQLNASINLQNISQTNQYNNLQYSAPKEKPIIQLSVNNQNDGFSTTSNTGSNKNQILNKLSDFDPYQTVSQVSTSQSKHSRNKSTHIIANYQTPQTNINLLSTPDPICILKNNFSTNVQEKDFKIKAQEEELKRSKTYIEHLERKIKLIVEENKILKSLLLENKKSSSNKGETNLNMSIMNTTNTSISNLSNILNLQSNLKSVAQTNQNNENIPPTSHSFQNSTTKQTKQPYFFPVGNATGNIGQTQTPSQINLSALNLNISNININNSTNFNQQQNMSESMKDKPQEKEQNQPINQLNVLKDQSNKQNMLVNGISETQKAKSIIYSNAIQKEENTTKFNNEKIRSLSVDIHAKRPTMLTDNSANKLDTSLIEPSQCNRIIGHTKYKNKIPKLNLEILPNYHGNSNKSINQQLIQQYLITQQKLANKIPENQA